MAESHDQLYPYIQYYSIEFYMKNSYEPIQGQKKQDLSTTYPELVSLTKKLCVKDCLLTLFFTLLMAVSFFLVNTFIPRMVYVQLPLKSQGEDEIYFGIIHIAKINYQKVINYFDFATQMVEQLTKIDILVSSQYFQDYVAIFTNVSEYEQFQRQRIYKNRGGLQKINISSPQNPQFQRKVVILNKILWQYVHDKTLASVIQDLTICNKINQNTILELNYECYSVPVKRSVNHQNMHKTVQQIYHQCQGQQRNIIYPSSQQFYLGLYNSQAQNLVFMAVSSSQQTLLSFYKNRNQIFVNSAFQIYEKLKLSIKTPFSETRMNQIEIEQMNQKKNYGNMVQKIQMVLDVNSPARPFIQRYGLYFELQIYQSQSSRFLQEIVLYFLPLIYLAFLFCCGIPAIKQEIFSLFSRKQLINRLFKFAIKQVFTGHKPVCSSVLQKGPLGPMYAILSSLVDKSILPIVKQPKTQKKKQAFKFSDKIREVMANYKSSVQSLMVLKNKDILNNRFNIQSYINDLCQVESKILKEYYCKAQKLKITQQFFKFAYLAILKTPEKFKSFLREDETPFPSQLVNYLLKMNNIMHEVEIVRQNMYEKFMIEKMKQKYGDDHQQRQFDSQKQRKKRNRSRAGMLIKKSVKVAKRDQNAIRKTTKIHYEEEKSDQIQSDGQSCEQPILFEKKTTTMSQKIEDENQRQNTSQRESKEIQSPVINLQNSHIDTRPAKTLIGLNNLPHVRDRNRPKINPKPAIVANSGTQVSSMRSSSNKRRLHCRFDQMHQKNSGGIDSTDQNNKGFKNWEEEENEEQIQIRIRVHMIPKYLAMLKDLDLQNHQAKKLNLEQDLLNLSEIIQNTRYLLTRHNKNIRAFAK